MQNNKKPVRLLAADTMKYVVPSSVIGFQTFLSLSLEVVKHILKK